jgi:transposase
MQKRLFQLPFFTFEDALFCMEHTGMYTRRLVSFLLFNDACTWLESSLQIKRSSGIARGKSDNIDSLRIAQYAKTHAQQANVTLLTNKTILKLKDLMVTRKRLLKAYQALLVPINEIKDIDPENYRIQLKVCFSAIEGLKKSIENIELLMDELIQSDPQVLNLFNLATSIKCVGKILTCYLLVYTYGFSRLTDTRKLACYCGVAPFEYSSGTSIRGKTHTSAFANKELKAILHMAAISSIKHNPEMRAYFEKKVAQGKNKMVVINAVRNKLLARVLAVVKRGTPYELNLAA